MSGFIFPDPRKLYFYPMITHISDQVGATYTQGLAWHPIFEEYAIHQKGWHGTPFLKSMWSTRRARTEPH